MSTGPARRADGEKLFIIPAKATRELDAYCLARQISRSEYAVELFRADKPNRESALAPARESEGS